MNDIRAAAGQDVITEIIPMENQDGITSDVQVMRFPLDTNSLATDGSQLMQVTSDTSHENGTTYIEPEDFQGSVQLVQNLQKHDAVHTVILDYNTDVSTQGVTLSRENNSQIFVQTPAVSTKPERVSLLKTNFNRETSLVQMEEVQVGAVYNQWKLR
ncbi:hypothetical protein EB796_022161 [Bugula neritina]|uniref:Uncharacterized protein n=1 Tax=Bugula neritina TaxID=10212 RepID=A0A7J7J026_BUGNE|nr:hypothetical protein EB796_022161 [Bugula neritina]